MIHDGAQHSSVHKRVSGEEEEIAYDMVFTRDKDIIAQYKQLRKDLYGIDPRFVGFRLFNEESAENYEDPDDQMLILHDGKQVYGGACLRISTPEYPIILNSEQDIMPPAGKFYFSLKEHVPEFELDKYAYAEFVRIVIDPRLRKGKTIRAMIRTILARCVEYRVRYMFGIADKLRTRLYSQIYTSLDLNVFVPGDVDMAMRPEYEDIKMYLIATDMKKFYVTAQDPDAQCLLHPRHDFAFY